MKNRFTLILAFAAIAAIGFFYYSGSSISGNAIMDTYNELSPQARSLYYQQSEKLTKEVPHRIVELDSLTIGCFGPSQVLQMQKDSTNLGGQCCGALKDIKSYEAQIKSLGNFIEDNGNINLIPRDPYDTPIEQAQLLTSFDSEISLTAAQQAIYDTAIENSHHGGPCCCKCWKWYVMSGLAKKLITDYGWDEMQIAELWDLSSSCGHDEDVDMHEHYNT